VLLQFRRTAGVLPACRHILEKSVSAEARFHAACALREAVLREWVTLPAEERTGLRTYILQYVLHHAAEPQLQVVRSILEGTLAVMLKRGWLDVDAQARAAFFQVGASNSCQGCYLDIRPRWLACGLLSGQQVCHEVPFP
jgi:hypothetical protein